MKERASLRFFSRDDLRPRRGEFDLLDPRPSEEDGRIQKLVRASKLRSTQLEAGDFDVLKRFAARASVFAIRRSDAALVTDALSACALIDVDRYDMRDFDIEPCLAASQHLGLETETLVRTAADAAPPATRSMMLASARRDARSQVVRTELGIGMLPSTSDKSPPVLALLPRCLAVARAVEATDRFVARLEGRNARSLDASREDSRLFKLVGLVEIHASPLRAGPEPQGFIVELFQLENDVDAALLARTWSNDHKVAISEGALALRSRREDVPVATLRHALGEPIGGPATP